jgi:hypothetical protein
MKIALLYCGRVKTYEECHESFVKYIFEPLKLHQVDSFLCHNNANNTYNLDNFIKLFNITKYSNINVAEQVDLKKYDYIPTNTHIGGKKASIYMYYTWLGAFNLMKSYALENDIKYDLVIYLRADMIFFSPIQIPNITENTIYTYIPERWLGINDQFAMGSYTALEKYMNIFNHIDDIYSKYKAAFHTESYVKLYLELNSITVKHIDTKYELNINRFN